VARRSTLRASDADRDSVIDRLRQAATEGRLAAHELEQRVAKALKAQTYGELDATVSDLPVPDSGRRRRPRSTAGRAVATVQAHPALILVAIPVVLIVVAAMIAIVMLWAAVTVFTLVCCHNRRMVHRGPWTWHQRQLRASRHDAVGGFTPWL
jgi:Flp pilus assembly protein TadB